MTKKNKEFSHLTPSELYNKINKIHLSLSLPRLKWKDRGCKQNLIDILIKLKADNDDIDSDSDSDSGIDFRFILMMENDLYNYKTKVREDCPFCGIINCNCGSGY
jgi:hypothetical protein